MLNTKTLLVVGGGALLLWLAVDTDKAKAAQNGGGGGVTVEGLAVQLAANIRAKGYDYSRPLCRQFQEAAGLSGKSVDGIYGPQTKALLAKYTAAPAALFKGAAS